MHTCIYVYAECTVLAENQGVITSPNYPNTYPNYLDICWKICIQYNEVSQRISQNVK